MCSYHNIFVSVYTMLSDLLFIKYAPNPIGVAKLNALEA
nr:MAG TPA: hypothetical protein [Caudoviricetes sp.]